MFKRLNTIYFKLALIVIVTVSVTLAIPLLTVITKTNAAMQSNIESQLIQSAAKLAPYLEDGTLSLDTVENIFSTDTFTVKFHTDIADLNLNEKQLDRLKQNHVVLFGDKSEGGYVAAVMKYSDRYAVMTSDTQQVFSEIKRTGHHSAFISVGLGVILILLCGRTFVKPILTLDTAAKRVAAGDFTVNIPNKCRKDELGSLIDSFNAMVRELDSVEMFRSSFVSDISHEFKTPLTTISGYAKLMQGNCEAGEREEYAQIIMEESARLSTLADNILMLNRLEKHEFPAEPESVEITEQVRRSLTIYETLWSEKNIDLRLSLEEVTVQGYGVLLMQVWTNLIDNAIKFSLDNGIITISLHHDAGEAVFVIENDGGGIPPEKQKRIFDKFYKGDHSRNTDGNGLGLAIVKRIVEIHGGTIEVDSPDGKGAIFTVRLYNLKKMSPAS